MKNRAFAVLALLIGLIPALSLAMTPYSQHFEDLVITDPAALGSDGWWVYGNVFTPEGGYLYGYGPFPAPNHALAFCAIADGQGGEPQGAQQLSVFSDYENGDHAAGNLIESNVFQEQTVGPEDVDMAWVFEFDAKRGNIAGESTAAAFIKTLDPSSGWALTNLITADMTAIPDTWQRYTVFLNIDSDLEGQIFQFGFLNTATLYESSGIYYDNIEFYMSEAIDAPETPAAVGATLGQNFPNPFNPKTRISFSLERGGVVDLSVFDLSGRKVATLHNGELDMGDHEMSWNGLADSGRPASSGQYWYVLKTPTGQVAKSMTLLK